MFEAEEAAREAVAVETDAEAAQAFAEDAMMTLKNKTSSKLETLHQKLPSSIFSTFEPNGESFKSLLGPMSVEGKQRMTVIRRKQLGRFDRTCPHEDIHAEAVRKRCRATKKPYSRSIVGATLEVIQKRRTSKAEIRDAAREVALRSFYGVNFFQAQ